MWKCICCPEPSSAKAGAPLLHAEARLLVVDGDGTIMDMSCGAAILIGTVEGPGNGKINLPNLSLTVEPAHGLNLLTCTPSPRRSMQTSAQAVFGSETLWYGTQTTSSLAVQRSWP